MFPLSLTTRVWAVKHPSFTPSHSSTMPESRWYGLLMDRGADVAIRAKVPGHYERPGEVLDCTPLGYARRLRDETSAGDKAKTIALLKQRGAPE